MGEGVGDGGGLDCGGSRLEHTDAGPGSGGSGGPGGARATGAITAQRAEETGAGAKMLSTMHRNGSEKQVPRAVTGRGIEAALAAAAAADGPGPGRPPGVPVTVAAP